MNIVLWVCIGFAIGSLAAAAGRALLDGPHFRARTACDVCRRNKTWWELIPLMSYLGVGGKCGACGTPVIITDFMMELLGGALLGLGAWRFGMTTDMVWWAVFALATLLIFYTDLRWMVIPRSFTVITVLVAIFAQWASGAPAMIILTALLGCLFYYFLYVISRGRFVGSGDVGLGLVLGIAAGTPTQLGILLLIAHTVGAIVAAVLLHRKRRSVGDHLPLGAFLVPAAWVVVLWFGWLR